MEKPKQIFVFDPFRLDPVNERLWRGTELLSVRPKPFAILRYLAVHPGRLVTKEELNKAIWPDTVVGETSLKGYIRDLREVLGDNPEAPRFIETVARRGYRFLRQVQRHDEVEAKTTLPMLAHAHTDNGAFVGRAHELKTLRTHFDQALNGTRQVVFVTGESGMGKTTLVDTFLQQLPHDTPAWIGHGQCIEHYGSGEAYLPVLEALSQLTKGDEGKRVIDTLLSSFAKKWGVS